MSIVFLGCTPFKILDSVISFDTADMIDVGLAGGVWNKCLGD
jgi:hypothetical protein